MKGNTKRNKKENGGRIRGGSPWVIIAGAIIEKKKRRGVETDNHAKGREGSCDVGRM